MKAEHELDMIVNEKQRSGQGVPEAVFY